MTEIDRPEAFGYTIFAEDLRTELNGQITLVGVFASSISINSTFPIILPKLVFVVVFSQLKSKFNPDLKVKILLPGETDESKSFEYTINEIERDIRNEKINDENIGNSKLYVECRINILAVNLQINQPGIIRVRVKIGDDVYKVGALNVIEDSDIKLNR